jgi:hypothetical protein
MEVERWQQSSTLTNLPLQLICVQVCVKVILISESNIVRSVSQRELSSLVALLTLHTGYCDNVIAEQDYQISEDNCDYPCRGDSCELCGGDCAIGIYMVE